MRKWGKDRETYKRASLNDYLKLLMANYTPFFRKIRVVQEKK